MSGTSADGVDACLCEISGYGPDTKARVVHLASVDYPEHVRNLLTHRIGKLDVEEVARLNFLIAEIFAKAALKCIEEASFMYPTSISSLPTARLLLISPKQTTNSCL